ncbi:MAG: glutamate-1-semialdehyde 2,1-aminomutase [Candidatus Melainabacteria bacterium]
MTTTLFTNTRTRSEKAFEEACTLMPGGVNSPVRAFKSVGGTPVFIAKAKGARVWDIDDNPYIDYVASWGPAILGHADPDVVKAIQKAAELGTSFGAPTLAENEMAALVIDLVPGIEKVRFVSSGTEAVMSAIRLARAYTGREKIIKFAGCYHGHADYLLVKAGSGATTLGIPDSKGIPEATAAQTLIAPFNDLNAVEALLKAYPGQVAAILVEPVAGNMGCILPECGFLEGLRALCDQSGAQLIFDEVMTGFRVALGGAQARYSIQPDITALGKIVGGGLPAAAYGGSQAIMATVAPEGPMYQAGTLSGNPLAMAAGLVTLKKLKAPGVYDELERKTLRLTEGLQRIFDEQSVPVAINQAGGMFSVFFSDKPVTDYDSAMAANRELFVRFFWQMLDRGVYLAPSAFEAGFMSLAHTEELIDYTLEAAEKAIAEAL